MAEQPTLNFDSGGFSKDIEPEDTGAGRIEEPFDPQKIEVRTRSMTVDLLLKRVQRGAINLATEFQRNSGVWTPRAQSRLIESMLLRIPVPSFYAAEDEDERWIIVDGIQRLTTVARFIAPEIVNESPLRLRDLEYLDYDGARYDDLPSQLQTRLDETEFVVHLITKETPEKAIFNIFGRINTGGLPLTRQELRHALIPGFARSFLRELAEHPLFLLATGESVSDQRMSDREMILRFLAFCQSDPAEYAAAELDDFLRESMKRLNDLDKDQADALRNAFYRAMTAAEAIFGPDAFRKIVRNQKRRRPINKALYETVSVNLAQLSNRDIHRLTERKFDVRDGLITLLERKSFNDAISLATGDRAKVRKRFQEIEQLFREIIDA